MKEKDSLSRRGIVHAATGRGKFAIAHFEPGPLLEPFVEHYWAIRYNLQNEPAFGKFLCASSW